MEAQRVIEKFKKELPEFNWEEVNGGTCLSGHYFVNEFWIDDDGLTIRCAPLLFKTLLEESENSKIKYLKYKFKYLIAFNEYDRFDYDYSNWDGDDYEFESEEELDFFISAIHIWMKKCDSLRKSDRNEKQLILIHPDLDELSVPNFLKDFDYIYTDPDNSDLRIGVMDARKWDFSKEELIEAISDNTASCFSIQPSDLEFVEDSCIWPESFMQDFYNKYPEARDIKEKYETDWD